ncbi:MAG: hypothetical protein LIQ30_00585 [Planctomycetes bacterium]|nr:hypothetical protein [Planctomycetota bacterium]MCD7896212.1 hypothetical protein [Planctomycetaceae bacterium]
MNIASAGAIVPFEMVTPSPREIAARTAPPPPPQSSPAAASAGVVINVGKVDVMA